MNTCLERDRNTRQQDGDLAVFCVSATGCAKGQLTKGSGCRGMRSSDGPVARGVNGAISISQEHDP